MAQVYSYVTHTHTHTTHTTHHAQIKGPDYSPIVEIAKRLGMQCVPRIARFERSRNEVRAKQQQQIVTEKGRKKLASRKIAARNSGGSRRMLTKLTKRSLGFDDNFGMSHASKDGQVSTWRLPRIPHTRTHAHVFP